VAFNNAQALPTTVHAGGTRLRLCTPSRSWLPDGFLLLHPRGLAGGTEWGAAMFRQSIGRQEYWPNTALKAAGG
jgi:hypothetical protein